MMKRMVILAVGLAAVLSLSVPALADVVTFSVANGSATLTSGAGTITIALTDTAVNPISIIQNISGISFATSAGSAVGSTLVSPNPAASYINIAANGTYSSATGPAVWFYSGSAGFYTLLWNGFTGTTGPAFTIVGAPDGNNVYSAANGSLTGNVPHNPMIFENATFVLNIAGITSDTDISDITILFGTSPTVPPPPSVPEPGTLLLLGIGLVGLAGLGRKLKG